MCASVSILQLHQQWSLPRSMGPRLCHLQGRQLRQKLQLVSVVAGWFKRFGRKPPQCVGRLVWKYLGGDCVGDLLLNVHRESKRLLEQRVLELYKFRMTARCFQKFAHQPLSIVERTRQQFLGLSLVTEPPDILPGGHENNPWWPSASLYFGRVKPSFELLPGSYSLSEMRSFLPSYRLIVGEELPLSRLVIRRRW